MSRHLITLHVKLLSTQQSLKNEVLSLTDIKIKNKNIV